MTATRAARPRPWARRLRVTVAVASAPVVLAEALSWVASRQLRGDGRAHPAGRGAQAVVVLGFPSTRAGTLHPLQRWRTEIGVRSLAPDADSLLIFTGGGPPGAVTEAEAMAGYAREALGVPAEKIRLETSARNTWENITFALPFVESADTVAIASDPLHAARGRRYLHRLRPELAVRVVATDDYRFLGHWWLKLPIAGYEIARVVVRAAQRHAPARAPRPGS
ncbi:YdcF family protein [Frankia sp. AiPs1]|uniref:YdcF family protein n=1 Tax=Frankia sp. AiPs1 TaxID=573493 RepID=UPI0020449900|nr:YdcF family protein [Frankia sp. AiPs1]MCM3925959.1 YdcF family protein [Frankia sp. AiPs1]